MPKRGETINDRDWYLSMWKQFNKQELSMTPFARKHRTSYDTLRQNWIRLGIATRAEIRTVQKTKSGRYQNAAIYSQQPRCRRCTLLHDGDGDYCEFCQMEMAGVS